MRATKKKKRKAPLHIEFGETLSLNSQILIFKNMCITFIPKEKMHCYNWVINLFFFFKCCSKSTKMEPKQSRVLKQGKNERKSKADHVLKLQNRAFCLPSIRVEISDVNSEPRRISSIHMEQELIRRCQFLTRPLHPRLPKYGLQLLQTHSSVSTIQNKCYSVWLPRKLTRKS